tara:strand:+ start:5442 stop:6422 length:981 start_codon:yes stop_codon:yes gene_type:complete
LTLAHAHNSSSFDEIREQWKEFQLLQAWSSVFLTPEWQETWWSVYGDRETLSLIDVKSINKSLGVAPLTLKDNTLRFIGDTDLFDYHDFITNDREFYPYLFESVEQLDWTSFELTSIPAWTPTFSLLPKAASERGYSVSIEFEDVVPGISLPSSWDEYLYLLNKKDRHELRRKFRRIESSGDLRLRTSNSSTLEDDLNLFISMMAGSREDKKDFLIPQRENFLQAVAYKMQECHYLKLFILELKDAPVAAVMCFDYQNTRLVYNSGYLQNFSNLSVGLILKALCIKDAIESGLGYFDLLRGPEAYKYHLGATDSSVHKIRISRSLL